MNAALVPDVRRVAVLRCNGLGDLVFALPALDALRAAYPEAEIVLLGRPWQRELLEARPGPIDRVVVVPVSRGVREEPGRDEDPAEVERFLAAMRAERFDLALQLHGGGRFSNPFVRGLGARVTAGSHTPDAEPLDRSVPYVYLQPEVLRYLELVGLVGAAPVTLEPHLAVTDRDRCAVDDVLGRETGDGPLVALHPGATDPRRRWPAERFASVGDGLAEQGARVLVTGSEPERPAIEEVVATMRRPASHLLDERLALGAFLAVLEACDLVVSNDSGPLHAALAVGTPTVGLYWGPNVINSPPLQRARHRPLASLEAACPVCGADNLRTRCAHDVSFLGAIDGDEVLAAAQHLLGLPVGDRAALERALDMRAPEHSGYAGRA